MPRQRLKWFPMTLHFLALETSSSLCGVALLSLGEGEPVVRVLEHDATAEHAERLLPMVDALLVQAGIARDQLAAVAFGQGPGGFTGLRVACGVTQGMCFALGIPALPVSSLQAAAARDFAMQQCVTGASRPAGVCVVVQDARMQEVYLAAYAASQDDVWSWQQVQEPVLLGIDDVSLWLDHAQARQPGPYRLLGDALEAYPALDGLAQEREWLANGSAVRADAATVAALGLQDWRAGRLTPPEHAAPVYVRDKVAFTTAEREQGAGGNPRAPQLPDAGPDQGSGTGDEDHGGNGSAAQDGIQMLPMAESHLDDVADIECSVQSHPWTRNNFADGLKAGYHASVVQCEGRTLGFSMLMLAPDIAHLLVIAVRPDQQNRGVGARLLRHCEYAARQHGLSAVMLEVRPSNGKALHFYQSRGYRMLATRKDYYPAEHGRREDAYVMKKELAPPAAAQGRQGEDMGAKS